MTRRTSTRALAREIYCAIARAKKSTTPTPDPSPQGGGEKNALQGGREQAEIGETASLTARARALYEDSAVPVRDIASVVGVTERTIYKYAAKQAWKPRYRWAPNRGWRAKAAFAPAKGAGGRFIRREDKGKPFARRLKATDAPGRARALADSAQAARAARLAQVAAEEDALFETHMRAHAAMMRALDQLQRYREEQAELPPAKRAPADDPLLKAMDASANAAMDWWEASGREWHAAQARTAALRSQGEAEERGAIGTSYERASGTE